MKITIVFLLAGLSLAQGSLIGSGLSTVCTKELAENLPKFVVKLVHFMCCYEEYKANSKTREHLMQATQELTDILESIGCILEYVFGPDKTFTECLEEAGGHIETVADRILLKLNKHKLLKGIVKTVADVSCSALNLLDAEQLIIKLNLQEVINGVLNTVNGLTLSLV